MEYKRLYRSSKEKMIAGVAGGLSEFFIIDPAIVRIIFIILALMGGGGVLIYIILWIALPVTPVIISDNASNKTDASDASENTGMNNPENTTNDCCSNDTNHRHRSKPGITGGIILITVGILFLADKFIPDIHFNNLWPIILVILGVSLLLRGLSKN